MLFHAGQVLKDRLGQPIRQPKTGERQRRDERTNQFLPFDEDQLRDVTHGDMALLALDSSLHGDEEEMKKNPAGWVKAVMRRERISSAIADALVDGDGWVELDVAQRDLLMDRLAIYAAHTDLRGVGPVLEALDSPPKERPGKKPGKAKANGRSAEASAAEAESRPSA